MAAADAANAVLFDRSGGVVLCGVAGVEGGTEAVASGVDPVVCEYGSGGVGEGCSWVEAGEAAAEADRDFGGDVYIQVGGWFCTLRALLIIIFVFTYLLGLFFIYLFF